MGRVTQVATAVVRAGAVPAVLALAAVLVVVAPPAADATNFSGASSGTGCLANNMQDNRDMTFHRSSLTTRMYNAVAFVNNNLIAPTDITMQAEQSTPDGNTDVVMYDLDYSTYCGFDWHPDGPDPDTNWVAGHAECDTLSGSKCQRFEVRWDTSLTDGLNDNGARTWACHELGHTLGLLHRNEGCMPATVPANAPAYSTHDVSHVNANY